MKNLHYILYHNTPMNAVTALGIALALMLVLGLLRNFIHHRLSAWASRTEAIWDDVLADAIAATKWFFIVTFSLMVGLAQLELPAKLDGLPDKIMVVLLILQSGIWITRSVQTAMNKRLELSEKHGGVATSTHFSVMVFVGRFVIWIVVFLLLLDNLGVNIRTLIASLGIGGVAIALALQNILGDLFASLSIAIDKPFLVGDFIIVDDFMGSVKDVGLKTTRLQSLSGEELIFSNGDLLKSRIRNYKRMYERRVVFGFGITYNAPPDKLEALTAELKRIVEAEEGVRFDRAHFKGFSPSSLDFEIVYFLLSPDFNLYMDVQQRINLKVMRYCQENDLAFAHPTQTVHVASVPTPLQTEVIPEASGKTPPAEVPPSERPAAPGAGS